MRFLIVSEEPEPCPYLPGQTARLPLRLPVGSVGPEEFDELLAEGDRRAGPLLYRTSCPSCAACEPLRVPVARFAPTRSQRRVARRNADVTVEVGEPQVTPRHVELFNRHKLERGLSQGGLSTDAASYQLHMVESCVDTREVRYLVGGRLVAVSILDVGRTAASSVYHYFDPDEAARSLGVFSVLRELEWCRVLDIEWYYLGLYVKQCRSLVYKAFYFPHQRRIGGVWRTFETSQENP